MKRDKPLAGKKIGIALTGSFCTISKIMRVIETLVKEEGATVYPIVSVNVQSMDTKFGTAEGWQRTLHELGCQKPIYTIPEAEPIGPTGFLDVLLIAPCSGNTMAKLCHGITDGPVLMAAKAHLRNSKPVVIALASNDGLGMNAKNLGELLNVKNVYFVPFGQDNAAKKPNSVIFDEDRVVETLEEALHNRQLQPLLVQYKG
ncbi:MAG: dipicolinate synthase subunit B [Bacillota bacterium]|jgi:dipicolinate synthase subunit B